jgi:galactokinase
MNATLKEEFLRRFGQGEKVRCFFAPGRVNLIGEHTDYNGGYVFPAALTFGTWALVRPREDGLYHFQSTNFEFGVETRVGELDYRKEDDWANYPKGVLAQLIERMESKSSLIYRGADILYHGNIPNGAGLSSSASIELVTAVALSTLSELNLSILELVQLCQRAENQFVGVNCGIMDQFAVGMGRRDHAMLLKCDTLENEYVPFRIDGYKLIITNTNQRRGLTDSKYNERRKECETGLAILRQQVPTLGSLGELGFAEWEGLRDRIQNPTIQKRLEHVVSEDDRVLKARQSLQDDDLLAFGEYMKQSHESLRDLYEVTGEHLDALFAAAIQVEGCIGSRMTGAGFGGCTVSLVKEEAVDRFKNEVESHYSAKTGVTPTFYVCDVGDGAREIVEEDHNECNNQ